MSAGTAYPKRYGGGFVDLPTKTTPIDQQFLNAVETALAQLLGAAPTVDGQVAQWDFANTRYGPALLLNKNIDPAAAIAKSKLDFTGANGIVNADIAGAAAIAQSKLALSLVQPTNFAAGSKITASSWAGGPPGSPATGDIWIATGVDANGVNWWFYYNGASASTYKWEWLGGPAMYVEVLGTENVASGTYTAAGLTAMTLTLGRGGDYDVGLEAWMAVGVASSLLRMSYTVGATAASDSDAIEVTSATTAASGKLYDYTTASRPLRRKTGIAAGTTLTRQALSGDATAASYYLRNCAMWVYPVRVA